MVEDIFERELKDCFIEKICKVIYFDEEFITDYVQIVADGELTNTMELLNSRNVLEEQILFSVHIGRLV